MLANEMSKSPSAARDVAIQAIQDAVNKYAATQGDIQATVRSKYNTPITPDNANKGVTALKASKIFPKIPYYIPGTSETGEMWVSPTVTSDGYLKYNVSFVDPNADLGKIRENIEMDPTNIQATNDALKKIQDWSDVAQKSHIRKEYTKVAYCFPTEQCSEHKAGYSSTEVDFLIYDDGSTAARIQRNKGAFLTGYNLSIPSAMLFSAYLDYMTDVGSKEFTAGSITTDQLDSMFK